MIKALLFDFSYVFLFPRDPDYTGSLNALHRQLSKKPGYHLLDYFFLNKELLEYITKLNTQYGIFMFTTGTIQESPELKTIIGDKFKKIYSAEGIGLSKKDPESYRYIAEDLKMPVGEILFIDDSNTNITASASCGLISVHYTNTSQLMETLTNTYQISIEA